MAGSIQETWQWKKDWTNRVNVLIGNVMKCSRAGVVFRDFLMLNPTAVLMIRHMTLPHLITMLSNRGKCKENTENAGEKYLQNWLILKIKDPFFKSGAKVLILLIYVNTVSFF